MKIQRMLPVFLSLASLFMPPTAKASEPMPDSGSPVGYWETISDVNHKPRSVIQLYESEGVLYGKAVKNLVPGDTLDRPCTKCPGELKDQTMAGMRVIWGLREKNGAWKGGKVLDPDNGKIYRCKLALSPDGDQLFIRGYLGISLFGRTQTWNRLKGFSP